MFLRMFCKYRLKVQKGNTDPGYRRDIFDKAVRMKMFEYKRYCDTTEKNLAY